MISDSIHSVEELERCLSEPTEADRSFLRDLRCFALARVVPVSRWARSGGRYRIWSVGTL